MILDKLAQSTRKRVELEKANIPLKLVKEKALNMPKGNLEFEKTLAQKGINFICEVKKASPSKGIIAEDFPYIEIAKEYEKAGASCISVLTEPEYFKGDKKYLKEISENVSIPLIRKDFVVGLSGECADELFAGYPWFTHEEMINANTFPWSRSVGERKTILNDNLKNIKIEELTNEEYLKTLKEVPHLDNEDKKTYRMRELFYLNLKWFMVNLLNRKDRSSMYNSLEVRVPFADYRIVDYAFNLPVDVKLLDGREKGLLRKALVGILPDEIIYRKKSPYPKTHNPIYTKIVCGMMNEILNDKTSPILQIINKDKVQEIVNTRGDSYKTPWFGQLMTGPQMIAYLIQVDTWLREYNVDILL